MKGTVLDYGIRDNTGYVSGDDGQRYTFSGAGLKSPGVPRKGQKIDFTTVDGQANGVFAIPSWLRHIRPLTLLLYVIPICVICLLSSTPVSAALLKSKDLPPIAAIQKQLNKMLKPIGMWAQIIGIHSGADTHRVVYSISGTSYVAIEILHLDNDVWVLIGKDNVAFPIEE